jgi:putative hydrolase of HD superfamily
MTTTEPHPLMQHFRKLREQSGLSLERLQAAHPSIGAIRIGSYERDQRRVAAVEMDRIARIAYRHKLALVPEDFDVEAVIAERDQLRAFRDMVMDKLRNVPTQRQSTDTTPTDAVIALGRLALAFGRVDRITYHEDGVTPESDTDHTVMLGLVACALADGTGLDTGMVAQHALVHDLVEAYAGDTATLRALSDGARADKRAREHAAFLRIKREFGATLSWLPDTLGDYEAQISAEARFVRAVDKLMPKITHIANECATLRAQGMGPVELAARYDLQERELMAYAAEFPVVFELRADLVGRVMALFQSQVAAVGA